MPKTLIVGDMHFRKTWHHADLFEDRRIPERQRIYDDIVAASEGCDNVVLGGDVLDARNNDASVYKDLVAFLERFQGKKVFIMSGNHQSDSAGGCAEDFLREVKGKDWHVVNNEVVKYDGLCLIPFFRRQQFGFDTDKEVVDQVLFLMGPTKHGMTVIHHAIAGTKTETGGTTDLFAEPVFPAQELLRRSDRVAGCHIHHAQDLGKLQIVGSIQNQALGETQTKRVLIWDSETGETTSVPLSGRKLAHLRNPSSEELDEASRLYDYVKISSDAPLCVPESLDGKSHVVESPKSDRKKVEEISDFSVPALLKVYSTSREVPLDRLMAGYSVIKDL